MDLTFNNLFFVFLAAIAATLGWRIGMMILFQLSFYLDKLFRWLRTRDYRRTAL